MQLFNGFKINYRQILRNKLKLINDFSKQILAMEVTESKHRTKVLIFYQFMFGIAIVIESAVAYKFRNWNDLLVYLIVYYYFFY